MHLLSLLIKCYICTGDVRLSLWIACSVCSFTLIFMMSFMHLLFSHVLSTCYLLGKRRLCFCSIGSSVSLSVSEQHFSKSYKRIAMKLYDEVRGGTRKNWFMVAWSSEMNKWAKYTTIVVALPDRGAGNDSSFGVSLTPPRPNIH